MVEEKERLVQLLNEYIDGPGLTIVIGQEHRTPDLRPFSIIASTYADGTRRGTVGVIGPMRMHYSRTIAVVDGVAQPCRGSSATACNHGYEPWLINPHVPSRLMHRDVERMDDEGGAAGDARSRAGACRRNRRAAQGTGQPARPAAAPGGRVR